MSAFLLGVPGKLKTLIDRLTSTRAGNLDNLDAAITTRAPSATALSSATWTGTKAGYLDAAISSRLDAAVVSAQSGKVDTNTLSAGTADEFRYVDVTLSAVASVAKCLVVVVGGFASSPTSNSAALDSARRNGANSGPARGYLTSVSNLRLYGAPGSDTYYGASVRWQVIEYK